jgi:DNA repair protein RecO (recombination protein O)
VTSVRSSLAVVLRARAYGESDKIVTFLTRDFGKLTGIGKGAQRSRRRFVNSLDPLSRVRVYLRLRPTATLAFLESCELLQPSSAFADPAKLAYASYLAELSDQLTVEEHPAPDVYELLADGLAVLESGPATGAFLRGFELQLLARGGYEPQLERCRSCQAPFAQAEAVFFDPLQGTLSCGRCRDARASMEVGREVVTSLAALQPLPLRSCRARSLGAVAAEAAQLTGRLLALHLTRPPRALRLIAEIAVGGV